MSKIKNIILLILVALILAGCSTGNPYLDENGNPKTGTDFKENNTGSAIASILTALIIFVIGIFIYLFPTFVAEKRNHHNSMAIFILNLLLGWSVIGWVIALVWAFTENTKK